MNLISRGLYSTGVNIPTFDVKWHCMYIQYNSYNTVTSDTRLYCTRQEMSSFFTTIYGQKVVINELTSWRVEWGGGKKRKGSQSDERDSEDEKMT